MRSKDQDDSPAVDVPLATFQELVAQYHHRLLSLEADLKDQAKAGGLKPRAFARRVKQLKAVHEQLAELQQASAAEDGAKLTSADIGLPLLDECTPEEKDVCEAFLASKEKDLARLEAETAKVQKWVLEATTGRSGPFRLTLRLSRLRRLIDGFDVETTRMTEADQTLSEHVDKLLASVKGLAKETGRTTLDGLIALFQQLDATITRVARLKAAVKREEQRTGAMKAWLVKEQAEMDAALAKAPAMAPPTPLAVTLAQAAAGDPETHPGAQKQKRRRRLLAQFLDEVVHQGLKAPDTAETLTEAAVLLARAKAAAERAGNAGGTP